MGHYFLDIQYPELSKLLSGMLLKCLRYPFKKDQTINENETKLLGHEDCTVCSS